MEAEKYVFSSSLVTWPENCDTARPCPFYSQGRCLFADSCNFLHDVRIKVKQPEIAISSPTPDVTISLTQSSPIATSTPSFATLGVLSPPRSPRLSSLLLALGDAIEPDDEVDLPDYTQEAISLVEDIPVSPPSSLPAANQSSEKDRHVEDEKAELTQDSPLGGLEFSGNTPTPGQVDTPTVDTATHSTTTDPEVQAIPSGLLSPLEMKHAPPLSLPLGQLEGPLHREDSVDSGYADGWTGPSPFSLSPPRRENTRRYSTLSLLSSPFGSPVRALSPKFTSPRGSTWPTSPLFSPAEPRSSSRPTSLNLSTSDDLDSPTDYNRTQTVDSPIETAIEIDEDRTLRHSIVDHVLSAEPFSDVVEHSDEIAEQFGVVAEQSPTPPTIIPGKRQLQISIPPVPPVHAVVQTPPRSSPITSEIQARMADLDSDQIAEEADTTALYDSYYAKSLYTVSPRHVDLPGFTPISSSASGDQPRHSAVSASTGPQNSPASSFAPVSPLPEFVAGSSKGVTSLTRVCAHGSSPPSSAASRSPSVQSFTMRPSRPSPTLSRQSSSSEISGQVSSQSRRSTKIPFGFRHSVIVRLMVLTSFLG